MEKFDFGARFTRDDKTTTLIIIIILPFISNKNYISEYLFNFDSVGVRMGRRTEICIKQNWFYL